MNQGEAEDDGQFEAEIAAATEVSTHFKRVLDGIRTYPKGHPTLKGYYDGLLERLAKQVQDDDDELYTLSVTPLGFSVHDHIVNKAEKLADSITHPLYLDGLKQLSVARGITADELLRFMEIWRLTLDDQLGDTHTFSTQVWEADLQYIQIESVDSYGDGGKGQDGKSSKERLETAIDELQGAPPAVEEDDRPTERATLRRMTRVTKEDLRQLKARGIPELSDADFQRLATGEKTKPPGLTAAEQQALVNELVTQHEKVIERVFDALFLVSLDCTPAEQEALGQALGLVLSAMLRAKQLDRARDNLLRQLTAARSGPPQTLDVRFQAISRLLKVLQNPAVLGPIVEALDDEGQREAAMTVLKFLPAESVHVLLEWLVAPELPASVKALGDLIIPQKPDPVEIAQRLAWSDEDLAIELLRIVAPQGPASWPVRKAALAHISPKVQVAAVKNLDKGLIAAQRLELLPLLSSPLPEIRQELFTPMVASHDKGVAPALCTLLRRVKVEPEELRRVLVALGSLGGPEATTTLRQHFAESSDIELKCMLANALAQANDEKARPLLEKAAKKLFFGGPLKEAAKEALKRLDANKKGATG